jgi:hypothetical protein
MQEQARSGRRAGYYFDLTSVLRAVLGKSVAVCGTSIFGLTVKSL